MKTLVTRIISSKQHSKRVRVYKFLLIAGILLNIGIVAFQLSNPLQILEPFSLSSVRVEDGKIVIDNPKLTHYNDWGDKIEMKAGKATVDSKGMITFEGRVHTTFE